MMIRFKCKTCGEQYEVDPKHAGKKTKCAKCKASITVPEASPVAPVQTRKTAPLPAPSATYVIPTQPATPNANVHVSLDQQKPTGLHGFFRAFGITSGFMAAIAAVVIGLPILACGGCLVSLIGIGATVEPPTRPKTTPLTSSFDSEPMIPESPIASGEPLPETLIANPDPTQAEPVVIQTLPTVDLAGRPNVFVFDDLTATIKDKYINDVRIVDLNGRPVTVDVLLENSSRVNWTPRVTFEFINAYGIVLGHDSISWALTALEPNKRYTESISYYANRFDDIFRYSPISKPPDFDKPMYLLISYR